MFCAKVSVSNSWRRACNSEFRTDSSRLLQSASDLVERLFVFGTGRLEPACQIDGCGDFDSVIVKSSAYISECPAGLKVKVKMVVPQFDGFEPCFACDADLIRNGGGTDRAGVQAVAKA